MSALQVIVFVLALPSALWALAILAFEVHGIVREWRESPQVECSSGESNIMFDASAIE